MRVRTWLLAVKSQISIRIERLNGSSRLKAIIGETRSSHIFNAIPAKRFHGASPRTCPSRLQWATLEATGNKSDSSVHGWFANHNDFSRWLVEYRGLITIIISHSLAVGISLLLVCEYYYESHVDAEDISGGYEYRQQGPMWQERKRQQRPNGSRSCRRQHQFICFMEINMLKHAGSPVQSHLSCNLRLSLK